MLGVGGQKPVSAEANALSIPPGKYGRKAKTQTEWVVSLFTTDVSTRRVSPVITFSGIRSLHRVGKSG